MNFKEFEELIRRLVEEEHKKEYALHGSDNSMSVFLISEHVTERYKQFCAELKRPTPQAVGYIAGFISGYSYASCRFFDQEP